MFTLDVWTYGKRRYFIFSTKNPQDQEHFSFLLTVETSDTQKKFLCLLTLSLRSELYQLMKRNTAKQLAFVCKLEPKDYNEITEEILNLAIEKNNRGEISDKALNSLIKSL